MASELPPNPPSDNSLQPPHQAPHQSLSANPYDSSAAPSGPPQGGASFFLDHERRLRTVWRFLLFFVGFIVIQVIVSIFAVIAIAVVMSAQGRELTQDIFQQIIQQPPIWLFGVMAIPSTLLAGLLVFLFRKFLDRRSIRSMGFVAPERRLTASTPIGFIFGFLPIVITAGVVTLLGGFRFAGFGFSYEAALMTPLLVFAAFQEEIIFRSYLLQNLLDIRRPAFGVLFTSFVFWLAHSFNPHAWVSPLVGVNLFGAGAALALAYMLSRNIWFPTVMHFAWNFAQGVVLSIPVSGMEMQGYLSLKLNEQTAAWITGGEFGLEASALTTAAEIAVIVILLALIWQRREDAQSWQTIPEHEVPLAAEVSPP